LAGFGAVVVLGAHDPVPGGDVGAAGEPGSRAGGDDAEVDEVVADPAGQLPPPRVVRHGEQDVAAVQPERDVVAGDRVDDLLGVTADDPAVLVVLLQHRGVPGPEPQAGRALPPGGEPDRVGQPDVAEGAGEQGHAAAVLDRLQLLGVPGDDHFRAGAGGVLDDAAERPGRRQRRLIGEHQVAWFQPDRAAGTRTAGEVAEELRRVIGRGDPGGERVAGRLRRRDPDHPPGTGVPPRPSGHGQQVGLAGPGGRVDDRDPARVGQRGVCGRRLIHAEPGPRDARVRGRAGLREDGVELRDAGAERPRGPVARHHRRAFGLCLLDEAFLDHQLGVRGVAGAAVALVDAAAVRAQERRGRLDRLGCLQAGHRLELARQRLVRELLQQPHGGGGVEAGAGQDVAEVPDQVGPGERGLLPLDSCQRLLRRPRGFQPRQPSSWRARRGAGLAPACFAPHRRRDRRQRDAEGAAQPVRPPGVQRGEVKRRRVLARPRGVVRRLRELRQLALGRLASVA
jgi:hypothetical protein